MTTELKPCPMCGKRDSVRLTTSHEAWDDEGIYADCSVVVCDASSRWGIKEHGGCGASGPCAETQEQAIAAWNRRAESEPSKEFDSNMQKLNIASDDVLKDALNTVLWLERRLPKGYGEVPHVQRTIAALNAAISTQSTHTENVSKSAGEIDLSDAEAERRARELLAQEYERDMKEGPYPTYAGLARTGNGSFTLCSIRAIKRALLAAKGVE